MCLFISKGDERSVKLTYYTWSTKINRGNFHGTELPKMFYDNILKRFWKNSTNRTHSDMNTINKLKSVNLSKLPLKKKKKKRTGSIRQTFDRIEIFRYFEILTFRIWVERTYEKKMFGLKRNIYNYRVEGARNIYTKHRQIWIVKTQYGGKSCVLVSS